MASQHDIRQPFDQEEALEAIHRIQMDARSDNGGNLFDFFGNTFRGPEVLFEAAKSGDDGFSLCGIHDHGHVPRRMTRRRNQLDSRGNFLSNPLRR